MESGQRIKWPVTGALFTRKHFTYQFSIILGELQRYTNSLFQATKQGNTFSSASITDLKPEEAALRLYFFYESCGSRGAYNNNMKDIRPFAKDNPAIRTVLEELDDKVRGLEEAARKAPLEVLRGHGLEYLLQPVR